ncbi:hypothetical protein V6N13_108639 [Hibiscus sabdariffa]|uniref:Uncharacterized protein n=1 Tax=Hibiscus sabdariffa TaxID=183260 RepID=A0ABR2SSR7_9ROSI
MNSILSNFSSNLDFLVFPLFLLQFTISGGPLFDRCLGVVESPSQETSSVSTSVVGLDSEGRRLRVSDGEDFRRPSFSFLVGFNTKNASFHLVSPPNLSAEGRWSNIHCAPVSVEINLGWTSKLGVVSVGLLRTTRLWPLVPREGVALLTQAFGKQMMNEFGLNVKDELHRIRMGFDYDFKVESKACPFRHFFQGSMEIVHWYSCTVYSLIGEFCPSRFFAGLKDHLVTEKFQDFFQEVGDKALRAIQSFTNNLGFARLFLPFGYLEYPPFGHYLEFSLSKSSPSIVLTTGFEGILSIQKLGFGDFPISNSLNVIKITALGLSLNFGFKCPKAQVDGLRDEDGDHSPTLELSKKSINDSCMEALAKKSTEPLRVLLSVMFFIGLLFAVLDRSFSDLCSVWEC